MTSNFPYKLGLRRDKKDERDHKLCVPMNKVLPLKYEIVPRAIYNQQDIGSCSANAIANQIMCLKDYSDSEYPSRLYQYWNSRYLSNNQDEDAGSSFRDCYVALARWGFCDEKMWGYDTSKVYEKPSEDCYHKANTTFIKHYQSLSPPSAYAIMYAISQNKAVSFGTMVYDNFNDLEDFVVPYPKGEAIGGHALLITSYDASKKLFGIVNSWGYEWGNKGMCYMHFDHVTNPQWSFDHWVISKE